jgi:hypothetical protein
MKPWRGTMREVPVPKGAALIGGTPGDAALVAPVAPAGPAPGGASGTSSGQAAGGTGSGWLTVGVYRNRRGSRGASAGLVSRRACWGPVCELTWRPGSGPDRGVARGPVSAEPGGRAGREEESAARLWRPGWPRRGGRPGWDRRPSNSKPGAAPLHGSRPPGAGPDGAGPTGAGPTGPGPAAMRGSGPVPVGSGPAGMRGIGPVPAGSGRAGMRGSGPVPRGSGPAGMRGSGPVLAGCGPAGMRGKGPVAARGTGPAAARGGEPDGARDGRGRGGPDGPRAPSASGWPFDSLVTCALPSKGRFPGESAASRA